MGGLTIRAALILGFSLTVVLWLITGYRFTQGIADVERQSAEMASRYVRAQEALASLRPHVLAASGIVRDVLLDRAEEPAGAGGQNLEERLVAVDAVVRNYRTAMDNVGERVRLDQLIKAELHLAGMASRLAPDIEVAAYRMIQEALTNVAKHARARRCDVTCSATTTNSRSSCGTTVTVSA